MLEAPDIATVAVFAAGLPARVTVSEIVIVPTDNAPWRSYAHAIANA
jgi:NADP-dependent 3-hydroxy acid dehydrogenase YdfG